MSVVHLGAQATSNTFNHGTRPRHRLHSRFNTRFHPHCGHYRRHVVVVGKIISVIVLLRISDSFGPLVFRATLLKSVYFGSHFIVFFLESFRRLVCPIDCPEPQHFCHDMYFRPRLRLRNQTSPLQRCVEGDVAARTSLTVVRTGERRAFLQVVQDVVECVILIADLICP